MKVFQIQDAWSLDNLTLTQRPEPEAGPGQVKLRMKAASVNYRDLVVAQGAYGRKTDSLPRIMLCDGTGEVVEVGEGVSRFAPGDRVCPNFFQGWISGEPSREKFDSSLGAPLDGTMAEYMVLSEQGVSKAPAHLSEEAAATLPCAALTAWSALITQGGIKAGDKVLVQGTGGVSLFALQFAKMHGAEVIVTSSSDEKLARAHDLGADHGINYRTTPEWGRAAREIAGGDGLDHIVEVGGAETLPQALRCIRPGGRISMIGVLSGGSTDLQLGLVVTRNVRLQGVTVGSREGFEAMARAIERHRLEPVIDRIFPFEELRPAMDHLASGAHFGKVCIRH